MKVPMAATLGAAASLQATAKSSLWVDQAPTHVRPYVIEHYANAQLHTVGQQAYRFPVTGNSSGGAFSLLITNAPYSNTVGVLPHIHETHHENIFCLKGRFQLWAHKDTVTEARLLTAGDYGSVPTNTTHTFQMLDPDTEMVGVIAPGGFEKLFFYLGANATFSSDTPFNPANVSASSDPGNSPSVISELESLDVYAQLSFVPERDLINGTSSPNSSWHDGANSIPSAPGSPYFIASNWGPKYLKEADETYQIIQPFVTPSTGEHNFTQGSISLSRHPSKTASRTWTLADHTALQVVEGLLEVEIDAKTATLSTGDVAFIPGGTSFRYWTEKAFAKIMYVCAGDEGLDQQLLQGAETWEFAVFPERKAT